MLMNTLAVVAGVKIMLRLSIQISTHQAQPGYSNCWVPSPSAAETNTESPLWHHSLWWLASNLVTGWFQWKEHCLILVGIDTFSGYGFTFPAWNASAKKKIPYYRTPYLVSWYSTQHCSWRSNLFPSKFLQVSCNVLQEAVYAVDQRSTYSFFFHSQDSQVQELRE